MVIIDKSTKWGYFVLCTKEMSVKDLSEIYVKEVFIKHGALVKIISDWDLRFVVVFWEMFTVRQRT